MSFAKPITGLMPPLLLLGLSAAALLFDPFGAAKAVRGGLFDFYESHTPHAAPGNAQGDPQSDQRVALVTLDAGSLAPGASRPSRMAERSSPYSQFVRV